MKRRGNGGRLLLADLAAAAAGRQVWRRRNPLHFAGRVVVITGGSRGLGLLIARELAAEGAKLAILARDAEELARAAEDLRGRGAEVLAVPCDVGNREEAEAAVARVVEGFGLAASTCSSTMRA